MTIGAVDQFDKIVRLVGLWECLVGKFVSLSLSSILNLRRMPVPRNSATEDCT